MFYIYVFLSEIDALFWGCYLKMVRIIDKLYLA